MRKLIPAMTALSLTLLAVPARADEGRIPIVMSPTAIAAPGKDFVTRNLAGAGGPVITIGASNVDIDLNGFTPTGAAGVPVISAVGFNGITIRNGTVVGGST